jgi:hypothetical protein
MNKLKNFWYELKLFALCPIGIMLMVMGYCAISILMVLVIMMKTWNYSFFQAVVILICVCLAVISFFMFAGFSHHVYSKHSKL